MYVKLFKLYLNKIEREATILNYILMYIILIKKKNFFFITYIYVSISQ